MERNLPTKTRKAMERVWQIATPLALCACGFLFSQTIDHEKRITAIEASIGPMIRDVIHNEIERSVPPHWFKAQVDKIAKDLEALKREVTEARQEIRDLRP